MYTTQQHIRVHPLKSESKLFIFNFQPVSSTSPPRFSLLTCLTTATSYRRHLVVALCATSVITQTWTCPTGHFSVSGKNKCPLCVIVVKRVNPCKWCAEMFNSTIGDFSSCQCTTGYKPGMTTNPSGGERHRKKLALIPLCWLHILWCEKETLCKYILYDCWF